MSSKPNIEDINKENHFKVPTHYFEALEIEIQRKIGEVNVVKQQRSLVYRFRYPAAAFSATCLALCIWIFTKNETVPVSTNTQPALDYAMYVDEHIDEFEDEIIFETYTPAAFEEVSEEEKIIKDKSAAVDEYLLDEGVDEDWIIEEM